jgi:hypothetical protein
MNQNSPEFIVRFDPRLYLSAPSIKINDDKSWEFFRSEFIWWWLEDQIL